MPIVNMLPNFTGILGYFTWKSAYWSLQLSMRNRFMLTWNWFFNFWFGRDLTRAGRYSNPVEETPGYDQRIAKRSVDEPAKDAQKLETLLNQPLAAPAEAKNA